MPKPRNGSPRKVARLGPKRTPKTPTPTFEVVQLFHTKRDRVTGGGAVPVTHHVTNEYVAELRLNDGILTHSNTVRAALPLALAEALLDAGVRPVRK